MSEDASAYSALKESPRSYFAEKLYNDKLGNLRLFEKKICAAYSDAVGSLTKGEFGDGHDKSYYRSEERDFHSYAEAVAQIENIKKYGKNIGEAFDFSGLSHIIDIINGDDK